MQSMPARMHAWIGGVADGVRGHPDAGAVRLVGDRRELLVGVLLGSGGRAMRHHAAGRRDLDHLRAVADLVAHARADLGDAVGDPFGDAERHDAGRQPLEHRGIEVPAVRSDGVAGRDDARSVVPALVDRALERHVEHVAAGLHHQPEVAHGREPGQQRRAGVHRAAQASGRRGRPGRRASGWAGLRARRVRRSGSSAPCPSARAAA